MQIRGRQAQIVPEQAPRPSPQRSEEQSEFYHICIYNTGIALVHSQGDFESMMHV